MTGRFGAIRRFARETSGTAILEFALVLPVMLLLAFGSYGLGQVLFIRLVLERAVETGARHLARVRDPACEPVCSPGATHALALARDDIVASTRVRPDTIRLATRLVDDGRVVVVSATADLNLDMLTGIGLPVGWTLTASHGERREVE